MGTKFSEYLEEWAREDAVKRIKEMADMNIPKEALYAAGKPLSPKEIDKLLEELKTE